MCNETCISKCCKKCLLESLPSVHSLGSEVNNRTPHKHAALIKAWADGAMIQSKSFAGVWLDSFNPYWDYSVEYRIKPEASDLEKYGVEVGDVWLMFDHEVRTQGVQSVDKGCAKVLIFRRGVVNKL